MISWNAALETGHDEVDRDHRAIVAQLNALEEALHGDQGLEHVVEVVMFLNTYVREHFTREENHMARVGCPAFDDNCRAHDQFISKLDGWTSRLRVEASNAVLREIHHDAAAWIHGHLLAVDCKLRGCDRLHSG